MSATSIPNAESSIAEIKTFLKDRGVNFSSCLEKADFLALVEKAVAENTPIISKPYPLAALLGGDLVDREGHVVTAQSLRGKVVGLYFSAHWCPPCRRFTPLLSETYKKLQASHPGQFEIIFLSADRSQAQFDEYYAEMPWLTIPYPERKRKEHLDSVHRIRGIPSLKLYNAEGVLYESEGIERVYSDPSAFPWD